MDLYHHNMQKYLQKYKRRRVLKRDIVKDDATYQGAFAEQGHLLLRWPQQTYWTQLPVYQVCQEKHMPQIQHTLKKNMPDAPRPLNLSERECPQVWMRLPPRRRPTFWDNVGDLVVPLEGHLHGHPPAGLLWERKMINDEKQQRPAPANLNKVRTRNLHRLGSTVSGTAPTGTAGHGVKDGTVNHPHFSLSFATLHTEWCRLICLPTRCVDHALSSVFCNRHWCSAT